MGQNFLNMNKNKRRYQSNLISLDEMVDSSLEILSKFKDKKLVVCFSGGKDSVVTEHLCRVSGITYDSIYNVTTIDPPEVIKFIKTKYPQVIFDKPKKSFFEMVKTKFSPSIKRRWCCTELKEKKFPQYDYKIMGIRSEESNKRRGRKIVDDKRRSILPIYNWCEWHIWEYIELNNIPYLSLYDDGQDRVGCIACPFHSYRQHMIDMKKYPHIYRKFKESIQYYIDVKEHKWTVDEWLEQYIKYYGMVNLQK